MRILKKTTLVIVTLAVLLFVYANIRKVSPSRNLEKVDVAAYAVDPKRTESERENLQKQLKETGGVTACSINKGATTVAIVFQPSIISEKQLATKLATFGLDADKIQFPQVGGCPIHNMQPSFSSLMATLDLRN